MEKVFKEPYLIVDEYFPFFYDAESYYQSRLVNYISHEEYSNILNDYAVF